MTIALMRHCELLNKVTYEQTAGEERQSSLERTAETKAFLGQTGLQRREIILSTSDRLNNFTRSIYLHKQDLL